MKKIPGALGIDIGRVITSPAKEVHDDRPDTGFLNLPEAQALEVPVTPHVWEIVPTIVQAFDGRVFLVSKAGPRIEGLTRRWLDHHNFFYRVGMDSDAVRFCRKRPEKRDHAVALGLTHFIDDRADVLEAMRDVVPHLFLFGVQKKPIPTFAVHVADWFDVKATLGV